MLFASSLTVTMLRSSLRHAHIWTNSETNSVHANAMDAPMAPYRPSRRTLRIRLAGMAVRQATEKIFSRLLGMRMSGPRMLATETMNMIAPAMRTEGTASRNRFDEMNTTIGSA